jgi:hypothetical protein
MLEELHRSRHDVERAEKPQETAYAESEMRALREPDGARQ